MVKSVVLLVGELSGRKKGVSRSKGNKNRYLPAMRIVPVTTVK